MFTGIVEALGTVQWMENGTLVLQADRDMLPGTVQVGESVAVNGCCLTVTQARQSTAFSSSDGDPGPQMRFELSPETLDRTSLGSLTRGSKVNLERAMRADGRFGGHLVQGHVDTTGVVLSLTPADNSTIVRFRVPEGAERYLIDKGSITIDGISLTVVNPEGREFDTWIIPHTMENTNLRERQAGDRVNVEFDVLARYVERLLAAGHKS